LQYLEPHSRGGIVLLSKKEKLKFYPRREVSMKRVTLSLILLITLTVVGSTIALLCPCSKRWTQTQMTMGSDTFARKLSQVLAGGAVALSVIGGPQLSPSNNFELPVAHADVRAQQKRTYFRFVPKLLTGKDFYKNELKVAIDKEDWPVVQKIFEEVVTKVNPEFKTVDSTDTYVNQYFFRPMTVFAGSFSERSPTSKTKALMEQEGRFEAAMTALKDSCVDKPGGFFGGEIKAPTGGERKKLVSAACAESAIR
jgi:hypothetical protein